MSTLQISLRALKPADPDGIAELEMQAGNVVLTALLRPGQNASTTSLRIPAADLAFWFAENWWRLRWESKPPVISPGWRMAHEMPAIGNGHAWPRVTIWGDRERVLLISRADAAGVAGPVRFLTNAVAFATAIDFEGAVDRMFAQAQEIVPTDDRKTLQALLSALGQERADRDNATWRRLEAINGYGPDEAPEALITALLQLEEHFSAPDVEEAAAAAAGAASAETLKKMVQAAETAAEVNFAEALHATRLDRENADRFEPWVMAEAAATTLRTKRGLDVKPLRNKVLADLAGMSSRYLETHSVAGDTLYALRLARKGERSRLLLTARWAHDRRFQLARAIGDAIWTNGSSLGAISGLASSRQKFQRAFAAGLLCPEAGLMAFFETSHPTDEDIAAAARHFHVSERTVRTVLVNKHLMERRRLGQPLTDPLDGGQVDELANAA